MMKRLLDRGSREPKRKPPGEVDGPVTDLGVRVCGSAGFAAAGDSATPLQVTAERCLLFVSGAAVGRGVGAKLSLKASSRVVEPVAPVDC
jgi:hypothetical protein